MARRRRTQSLSIEEVAALAAEMYPFPAEDEDVSEAERSAAYSAVSSQRIALVRAHGHTGLEYLRLRVGIRPKGKRTGRLRPTADTEDDSEV